MEWNDQKSSSRVIKIVQNWDLYLSTPGIFPVHQVRSPAIFDSSLLIRFGKKAGFYGYEFLFSNDGKNDIW